ncbi:hypothetical protein ABPG72_002096 [Tetrahymena utriculariae]
MPRALSPYSRGIIEGHRQAGQTPQQSLDLLQESQKMRGKEATKSIKTIKNLFQKSIDQKGEMQNNYENCGRKREYSERFKNQTKKHFKENPNETLRSYSKNKNLNPKEFSHQTISTMLHDSGLNSYKIPTIMYMTDQQRQSRLEFAQKYKSWKSEWKDIIFSDECIMKRGLVGNKYVWSTSREKIKPENCKQVEKYPVSIHIWGMIGYEGPISLQVVTGKLNSKGYTDLLEIAFSEFGYEKMRKFQFQQDLASCHTSAETRNWLKSKKIEEFQWIAKGADLSPIEKCWAMIKSDISNKLFQNEKITEEELYNAVKEAFYKSKKLKEAIPKMYNSLPENIKKMIKNKDPETEMIEESLNSYTDQEMIEEFSNSIRNKEDRFQEIWLIKFEWLSKSEKIRIPTYCSTAAEKKQKACDNPSDASRGNYKRKNGTQSFVEGVDNPLKLNRINKQWQGNLKNSMRQNSIRQQALENGLPINVFSQNLFHQWEKRKEKKLKL